MGFNSGFKGLITAEICNSKMMLQTETGVSREIILENSYFYFDIYRTVHRDIFL